MIAGERVSKNCDAAKGLWTPRQTTTPLPGWRRFRCGGCSYSYEQPAVAGSPMPDLCGHCGRPWVAVSEAVGAVSDR